MKKRPALGFSSLLVAASVVTLAACAGDNDSKSSNVSPPATEQPATVIGEQYVETEATIEAVDAKTRWVTLRTADGKTQSIKAPAEVDLARLKKGDVVVLSAYERLSVQALPPGSAPLGVTQEAAMAKSGPGETPSRAVGEQTSAVFEIASIDQTKNSVTLRGADGGTRTLDVRNPDNQRKLKTLKPGDLVEIELFEAVAVSIKPKS